MESTELDIRASLDGALHYDGGGGLEGMAAGRLESKAQAIDPVRGPVGPKRALDAPVLRSASARLGFRRNSCFARVHSADDPRLPAG